MVQWILGIVWGPWLTVLFLAAGIYFTVRFRGFQITGCIKDLPPLLCTASEMAGPLPLPLVLKLNCFLKLHFRSAAFELNPLFFLIYPDDLQLPLYL